MISTTASTATKSPPHAATARRIKIPLPPAPPTTPRLGVPPPPLSSYPSSSNSSSTTSSANHSPSSSLSSLGSLNSYSSAVSSFSPNTSLRYRGSSRHTAPPSPKCAELAGGTAAECAVVFCCCPCGLVNLLYFAVLKLPAGLCRRAIRNRRRRMIAKKKIGNSTLRRDANDEGLLILGRTAVLSGASTPASLWRVESAEPSEEMWQMEKEMWNLFYGTGFWRSPSQREVI